MERAFVVKKEAGMYRDILLVDDIFTTGNTVNECAKLLKNANAKIIDVFTLAKD